MERTATAAAASTAVVADATATATATTSTAAMVEATATYAAAAATATAAVVWSLVLRVRYKTIKEVYTMCYIIYNFWRLDFRKGLHKKRFNILQ